MTPLYPQKLALTSPTGGGRSVGIVRWRTKATEFFYKKCVIGIPCRVSAVALRNEMASASDPTSANGYWCHETWMWCHVMVAGVETWCTISKRVKCTLVQALRLCTGRTARRGSRGIALPFHDHGTRWGWGVSVTPWPLLTPGKDPVPL